MKKHKESTLLQRSDFNIRPVAFFIISFAAITALTLLSILMAHIRTETQYFVPYDGYGYDYDFYFNHMPPDTGASIINILSSVLTGVRFLGYIVIAIAGAVLLKEKTHGLVFAGIHFLIYEALLYASTLLKAVIGIFVSGTAGTISASEAIIDISSFILTFLISVLIFSSVTKKKSIASPVSGKVRIIKTVLLSVFIFAFPYGSLLLQMLLFILICDYPVLPEDGTLYAFLNELYIPLTSGFLLLTIAAFILFIVFKAALKDKTSVFLSMGLFAVSNAIVNACIAFANVIKNDSFIYWISRLFNLLDIRFYYYTSIATLLQTIFSLAPIIVLSVVHTAAFVIIYTAKQRKNKKAIKKATEQSHIDDSNNYSNPDVTNQL